MFSSRKSNGVHGGNPTLGTKSLRFRSSASAYLNRTVSSASNLQTWTWSAWVKRGSLTSTYYAFFSVGSNNFNVRFNASTDCLEFYNYVSSTFQLQFITTQVFRDPSAWYHIVIAMDTTQATSTNRTKLYVNGLQVTSFSTATYPTQNTNTVVNSATGHYLGENNSVGSYFDGYLADVYLIDGQALTPSSFGSTNGTTGQWSPAQYTGTFGTNGFYLPFSNTTSTTTLGYDTSGNGNNWTTTGISLSAGATYDSMNDVPVAYSATAANYAVMNPNANVTSNNVITNGNLTVAQTGSTTDYLSSCTFGITSNTKWYFEMYWVSRGSGAGCGIGITSNPSTLTNFYSVYDASTYLYLSNGGKAVAGTYSSSYGASFDAGATIGVAYDGTSGNLTFYYNNTSQGTLATGLTGTFFPCVTNLSSAGTNTLSFNFGQQPFTYTPPSGYNALNTYNLPTPAIAQGNKYMDATLFTGNASTQVITNASGFQPDFVWTKSRNNAYIHFLYDSNRGVYKYLTSNNQNAEATDTLTLESFNSNGFTLGADDNSNYSGSSSVAWQWQAGKGTNSSNTNGSITSTVSVSTTAGFSVVTYTGTGSSGQTVGHGLGIKPAFIIAKRRTGTGGWVCWQQYLTGGSEQDRYIYLNLTDASGVTSGYWGTGITSSTFGVWSVGGDNNASGATLVAYCFAPVAGFSAFGSYTGNGSSNGPFVYLGFQPKYLLIKRIDSASDWYIWDSVRNTFNTVSYTLKADTGAAETNATAINILSNGFQCADSAIVNVSSGSYIYACFASNPFAYSNAF